MKVWTGDLTLSTEENAPYRRLHQFIELLVLRSKDDFDNIVVLTGLKGSGKSTLAFQICRMYSALKQVRFDLEKNIIYSDDFDEIFSKVNAVENGGCLWFDEAGRIILSEDWNTRNSKQLKKLFAEFRTKHLLVVLVLPFSFTKIDAKYRESLVNFWLWVPSRGKAIIFSHLNNPVRADFAEDEILEVTGRINYYKSLNYTSEQWYQIVKNISTFVDVISFPDFPKEYKEKYLELRNKAVFEKDQKKEEEEKKEDEKVRYKKMKEMYNKIVLSLIHYVSELNNVDINVILRNVSKISNVDFETIRNFFHNNIKPKE